MNNLAISDPRQRACNQGNRHWGGGGGGNSLAVNDPRQRACNQGNGQTAQVEEG